MSNFKKYAEDRQNTLDAGNTPKWAEGWIICSPFEDILEIDTSKAKMSQESILIRYF